MYALMEYYETNHSDEYDIIFKDSKIINQSPIKKIFSRLLDYSRKYDMVISDYPFRLFANGEKSLFINHGYGTKRTPGKEDLLNPQTMKVADSVRENVDYIITMSPRDESYFFRYESSTVSRYPDYLPLGLPRTDIMFDEDEISKASRKIRERYGLEDKKILLYCPTWRDYELTAYTDIIYGQLQELNEYLNQNNWVMIYRPHYLKGVIDSSKLSGLSNVVEISSEEAPDAQEFLMAADALMTDYSSIYLDYLIMNRPIIFYSFDIERYQEERGLEIDFENDVETPGPKINSINEVSKILEQLKEGQDDFSENRNKARKLFYQYLDGNSCKRIWQLIDKLLE